MRDCMCDCLCEDAQKIIKLLKKGFIMMYFEVEKEKIYGRTLRYPVNSDGTQGGGNYEVDNDKGEIATAIVIGFVVNVYDEQGLRQDTQFYPVVSDTSKSPICDDTGDWVFESNEREVLAKIWEDHAPEDGWQNNMW